MVSRAERSSGAGDGGSVSVSTPASQTMNHMQTAKKARGRYITFKAASNEDKQKLTPDSTRVYSY